MILDVQDRAVSAKMGEYLATAKASECEDGVKGWAVHAWIGDRQMVSAWCQLDRVDAERACRLLVRWLANRPKFRGDSVKEDKGKTLKAAGRKKTCEICGREFVAVGRGCKKYCSRECAKEAEKRKAEARGARRRKIVCGVRNRDGSIARPAKTYAEIQAANRARPIASGWRGRAVAGGGAAKAGAK